MRVTFVLPCYPWRPIGGFRVVYEYANRLVAKGHAVSVVHPRRLSRFPPPTASNFDQRLRRRVAQLRDLISAPGVEWQPMDARVRMLFVRDLNPELIPDADVIFATAWQTAEYVFEYPPPKGRKFYLVQDFEPWLGPKDRLEKTWRWPFKKITVSRWLYEKVRNAGVSPQDVVNIPNGVDHRRFRQLIDFDRRPKKIALFYGLSSYKAAQDGVAALELAKARCADWELTVFGPGSRRPAPVPPWAVYRGNAPEKELIATYNESQVFVSSSLAEGFAFPPAEAMACGCAVASTDCGGIREFAKHEVTALLSPPRDTKALASNIIRLLEDEALRRRLAAAGHDYIQQFTWDRSTNQLEEFIRSSIVARLAEEADRGATAGQGEAIADHPTRFDGT